jgi:hypothetical protein
MFDKVKSRFRNFFSKKPLPEYTDIDKIGTFDNDLFVPSETIQPKLTTKIKQNLKTFKVEPSIEYDSIEVSKRILKSAWPQHGEQYLKTILIITNNTIDQLYKETGFESIPEKRQEILERTVYTISKNARNNDINNTQYIQCVAYVEFRTSIDS